VTAEMAGTTFDEIPGAAGEADEAAFEKGEKEAGLRRL